MTPPPASPKNVACCLVLRSPTLGSTETGLRERVNARLLEDSDIFFKSGRSFVTDSFSCMLGGGWIRTFVGHLATLLTVATTTTRRPSVRFSTIIVKGGAAGPHGLLRGERPTMPLRSGASMSRWIAGQRKNLRGVLRRTKAHNVLSSHTAPFAVVPGDMWERRCHASATTPSGGKRDALLKEAAEVEAKFGPLHISAYPILMRLIDEYNPMGYATSSSGEKRRWKEHSQCLGITTSRTRSKVPT